MLNVLVKQNKTKVKLKFLSKKSFRKFNALKRKHHL